MSQPFSICAQTATVGAEVVGLQLGEPLSAETLAELHRALLRYQVLVFPDQKLDDEQHLEFARHWGKLQVHGSVLIRSAASARYAQVTGSMTTLL